MSTQTQSNVLPRTPSFRLDGKKALVTGAGRGIGLASAVALAESGAHVTLAARSEHELQQACRDIKAIGGQADYVVLDVTDSNAVDQTVEAKGPFQVLVNCAGMNRPKELIEVTNGDIDDIFALNVKASFYVARSVVRSLLASGLGGSIINVSSQMGIVGSPRRAVYCASKHAIEGMTKALAWEVGVKGIRVNTVCPTFIETAFTENMFKDEEFLEWVKNRIAIGRVGRTEELMGAIVFLASDAASLVTGSALMVDGGWTAA